MSYLAGAELPCVIVDVMRGGPGSATSLPSRATTSPWSKAEATATTQPRTRPASVQEMADFTMLAFRTRR